MKNENEGRAERPLFLKIKIKIISGTKTKTKMSLLSTKGYSTIEGWCFLGMKFLEALCWRAKILSHPQAKVK